MTPRTSVAVVGLGTMGQRHLRTLRCRDDVDIVAVADHHTRALDLPWYVDVEALLAAHRPSLVVVSVPARSHYDVVRRVVETGAACVVDKPFVVDVVQAAALGDASATFVSVAHTERWNAAWIVLRDGVRAAGAPVRSLRTRRTGPRPPGGDVGPALDLAIHDADLAFDLLGTELHPVAGADANGLVQLRFRASSTDVELRAGWDELPRRTIEVITEASCWRADLLQGRVTVADAGDRPSEERVVAVDRSGSPLERMYDDVLDALRSGGPPPVSAGAGARAVRAVLAGTLTGTI